LKNEKEEERNPNGQKSYEKKLMGKGQLKCAMQQSKCNTAIV
jgi:hypothetical protein